ncbi:MAG: cytochrome c3 family protein [Bryobacteraceae bacterium]
MANASGPALDGVETAAFNHSASGVQYQISVEDSEVWLEYSRPGGESLRGKQKLEYFLGSGNHGRTYLYSVNGYWFETPIAYYARKHGYDMRPAYLNDEEMPFNLPVSASCLRCHMSGTQVEDPGTRNHYKSVPFLHGGITCEACHGDSSQHVAAGGKAAIVNPAKLDAERRDSVCISCHLEGDASVERRNRSAVDYKPGERFADYVSSFVRAGAAVRNRAVSQVEAQNSSQCKRVSGDRMSCMSCHNPHYSPQAGERVAFYRGKCLACHTQWKYATAHYPENQDCTSCHMPKSTPTDIPHEQWTDHRILRQASTVELQPAISGDMQLIPAAGTFLHSTERDLGLAYYNLVSDGDLSISERAWSLLEGANKTDPADIKVLTALGVLAQLRNDRQEAYRFYKAALERNTNDYTAAMNCGVLLARSGQLKSAAELWESTFTRNEDITELGMNLASARCMLGDKMAAESVLRRVLLYSPDHQRAREELSAMESGGETCALH